MPDALLERLNRYKLASGKGWRQIAQELGLPDQSLLRWLSGGGAPPDFPRDEIERRLRAIEETARAPRPAPPQPARPVQPQPPPPQPAAAPEPAPPPDVQFRERDLPALAEAAGAIADDWIARGAAPGRARPGAAIVAIPTGIPALDAGLGGIPPWSSLCGGTRAERRAVALAIAAHAISRRPDQSVLLTSGDLAEEDWARLWMLLYTGLQEERPAADLAQRLDSFLVTDETLLERVVVAAAELLEKREPRDLAGQVLRQTATSTLFWIVDEPSDPLLARLAGQIAPRQTADTPAPGSEVGAQGVCAMVLLNEPRASAPDSWPLCGTIERALADAAHGTGETGHPVTVRIRWSGEIWLAPASASLIRF